jgi:predicted AAA+ superfamily ATPase
MDGHSLLAVAEDWSYWHALPPESIPRSIQLPQELRDDLALVVQGVRRSGKSTFLAQLIDRYELDRERCLFVNFEDPRLSSSLDYSTLQGLVDAFEEAGKKEAVFFFDEIQHVQGWQKWLRSQLDRRQGSHRYVVTGSNAHLLSGELASSLTGRYLTVELFPFDYDEFRMVRKGGTVDQYLEAGGFPAPLLSLDADRLLRSYFVDIVERDVRERVGARSSLPLRQLVQMLYESAGSELSLRRVAASVGIAVDTASLYVEAAESAYLVFSCPYFAWSERKRAARNKKYYPVDTGLRRVAVTRTGEDRGKMLECATFLKLRQRYDTVYYWRGRGEVDFVVEHEGTTIPVQVSWQEPTSRHLEALDEFYEEHPRAGEAVLVSAESYASGLAELPGE